MDGPQKIKIEPPYDSVISLLGMYPKTVSQRDICNPMFIAPLFTITKMRKEPKCLSMDEWVKKIWYMHTIEYY